jgi:hypothetical protein
MDAIRKIGWADPGTWRATLASLLPLWLLSLAILSEGFPRPLVSPMLGGAAFVLAIAAGIVLLWKGWLTFEVLLYSLFPILLVFLLDEISTSYKTPFILLCALLLTVGIIGYHRSLNRDLVTLAWLTLLLVAIVTWVFASYAAQNYWQMVGNLRFPADCMPYEEGCAPLAGRETLWWVLFFKL